MFMGGFLLTSLRVSLKLTSRSYWYSHPALLNSELRQYSLVQIRLCRNFFWELSALDLAAFHHGTSAVGS